MREWIEKPLNQLVTFQKGRKVDTSSFCKDGYSAYLGASGIEGREDGYGDPRFGVIAKPSDTLMLWDGERSGLVGFGQHGVVASTVSKLSPNESVDPQFLYFSLLAKFDWIQHRRTGTGVPHVPKDLGRVLKIRLPKQKATQAKIAAILSTIDTAIEQTEALIEKCQHIKAGLMHDIFTRGVLPSGQLRPPREQAPELYQETAIGWIPREWRLSKAGDHCSLITKGTTPASSDMWESSEGIRFLRVDNLTFDGRFDLTASSYRISDMTHTMALSRSKCVPGDVLMNIVGPPLGKVSLVTAEVGEVNINQAIALFRPTASLSSIYLLRWLLSTGAKRWLIQRAKQTSGQLNLTLAMCQKLEIPLPNIEEQGLMEMRLQAAERLTQSEMIRLKELQTKKLGLMQDLLTGRVPVTLDVPEPQAEV